MYKLRQYSKNKSKEKKYEKILKFSLTVLFICVIILAFTAIRQLSLGNFETIGDDILEKEGFRRYYDFSKRFILIILALLSVLTLGVFNFLNIKNKKQNSKNFVVLYSYGYSKKKIRLMIIYGNLRTLFCSSVVAIILTSVLYEFYLKKSPLSSLYKNMFTSSNIGYLLLLVLFICIVFVISSFFSFNQKKISQYFSI